MARGNCIDVEKLKSEPGANITYLRVMADDGELPPGALTTEIRRACDDIEAYREIVGLVMRTYRTGKSESRLRELLEAMTWGNP